MGAFDKLNKLNDNVRSLLGEDGGTDLNPLSYARMLDDIDKFRNQMSGKTIGSQFEDPCPFYFKVFFYFNNSQQNGGFGSNLLCLNQLPEIDWNWKLVDGLDGGKGTDSDKREKSHLVGTNVEEIWSKYKQYSNTAMGYLTNNNETTRIEELTTFVNILSNISSQTPWMIQSVEGLKEVLVGYIHPITGFTIPEEPKSIKLKMLHEPYDMRISAMLNAYRNVVVDRVKKLVVLPENLRKFDMGIYIFPAPYYHFNRTDKVAVGGLYPSSNYYNTSSMYIELHDCEFDILNGLDEIDSLTINEPKYLEYSLNILVGQAYLTHYNEFMDACMGDMVNDMFHTKNNDKTANLLYNFNKGLASKILGQAIQLGENKIEQFANRVTFGNLYGLEPKQIWDTITSGNIGLESIGQMKRTLDDLGVRNMNKKGKLGNFYRDASNAINNATRKALDWDTGSNKSGSLAGEKFAVDHNLLPKSAMNMYAEDKEEIETANGFGFSAQKFDGYK